MPAVHIKTSSRKEYVAESVRGKEYQTLTVEE
jgi:hypothetical protein